MTGKLNEHPLAELLREVVSEKLSGALRLEQERVKTAIFFDSGELIYAASNLRPHRLLELLRRWRVITSAQYASLSAEPASDTEVGRLMVEQGVLTDDALREVRARQAMDVLRPALLWTSGTWSFDPRVRLSEVARVHIELQELLMEAARRFPKDMVAARFPNTNEKIQPGAENYSTTSLQPVEAFVLSRIDGSMRLHELLSVSGLSREDTLQACYTLVLGGLIERERPQRAFTPEEVAKALAMSAAAAKSAQAPARAPEAKKSEEAKKQEPEVVDERSDLEEALARVSRATNHYEVLGVIRSADQETLKQTYHRLARRFHPDRFHQDAALYTRVQEMFARIAQAYDTLRDRASRATYDLKLEKEMSAAQSAFGSQSSARTATQPNSASPPPSTSAPSAEESYQRGMTALKMGNKALALLSFAEAARLEPKVGRYRVQYGQALAENVQMRHRAETEIQAAITLEPANINYRLALAKLYQNLGFLKRAQGEIERALALDAQNAEALELLQQLQLRQDAR